MFRFPKHSRSILPSLPSRMCTKKSKQVVVNMFIFLFQFLNQLFSYQVEYFNSIYILVQK